MQRALPGSGASSSTSNTRMIFPFFILFAFRFYTVESRQGIAGFVRRYFYHLHTAVGRHYLDSIHSPIAGALRLRGQHLAMRIALHFGDGILQRDCSRVRDGRRNQRSQTKDRNEKSLFHQGKARGRNGRNQPLLWVLRFNCT